MIKLSKTKLNPNAKRDSIGYILVQLLGMRSNYFYAQSDLHTALQLHLATLRIHRKQGQVQRA